MKALVCIASLAAGNFLFVAATSCDWEAAFERSFYQAGGIACYAIVWRRETKQPHAPL